MIMSSAAISYTVIGTSLLAAGITLVSYVIIRMAKDLLTYRQKEKVMLDSIADALIATDRNGTVTIWNHAAEHLFGYTADEAMGCPLSSCTVFSNEQSPDAARNAILSVLTGKNASLILDNQIAVHRQGKTTPVSYSIAAIPDVGGKRAGVVIVIRDITKEKEIDRAKTEFVSLASHQLRTPLSAINWYAEMLMSGDAGILNKEQAEYLKEIYHGNARMTELVNSLLNVSRLELGTIAVEPKPTNLAELCDSVLAEQVQEIKAKELIMKKKYDALPEVAVDPRLMRMIVQNLMTNAVKYTPNKGTITLQLKKKGKQLELTVADTGYGIPKSQQSKIFTKLFRADNVREKIADGTGLGLYIIKRILETGGGDIEFTSVENKGTMFTVTLPLSGMSQKTGSKGIEA